MALTQNTAPAAVLTRHGCPIHYWLHGDDASLPLLVLTHGAGCDHRMFDPQLPALDGLCRTLTWDVRGHGQSRPMGDASFTLDRVVDDLVAILDHIGTGDVIIGGQSMGGLVAQVFAERCRSGHARWC
jgi:pimeloyl-ACP methyl ester carboxylesterase